MEFTYDQSRDLDSRVKNYLLNYARFVSVITAIFFPIVGIVLLFADPAAIDNLGHRLIISFFCLLGVGLSFKIDFFKDNLIYYTYLIFFASSWWVIWIVSKNQFSMSYSLLMITAIASFSMVIYHKRINYLYLISTAIILSFVTMQFFASDLSPYIILLSIFILLHVRILTAFFYDKIWNETNNLNLQLKESNEQLEKKVEERTLLLQRKNKELESYIYIFSHDLKSPLNNIKSFSRLINSRIDQKDYKDLDKFGEFVDKGVVRMESIINDLLTYGRLGINEKEHEKVYTEELIEEIMDANFSSYLPSEIKVEIEETTPKEFSCDKNQISLLFQNLLGNALKYNDSEQKLVKISGQETEDFYNFSIQDNGIGIDPQHENEIFEMFTRLQRNDQYEGTGIGLAICKKIVNNHKGEISIASDSKNGTTFNFSIGKS